MRALLAAALAVLLAGCATPATLDVASAPLDPPACPAPCVRPVGDDVDRSWEPSVAVDPRDPDHVVVGHAVWGLHPETHAPTSWLVSHASFDGGVTWKTTWLPGGPTAGPSHPLATAYAMGDAMVAILPDGTVLYAGLAVNWAGAGARDDLGAQARKGYDVFVARSSDGGLTYPDVSVVRRGSGLLAFALTPVQPAGAYALWDANDKEWLAVGPSPGGTVLLAWSRILGAHPEEAGSRHDIVASVSKDGGRTWEAQSLGESAFFPSLAARDGRLVLAFAQRLEDAPHIIAQDKRRQAPAVTWSTDGGATWSAPLALDASEAPGRVTPQVVIPPGGAPIVTYFHAREEGAEYRLVALGDAGPSEPVVLDAPRAPPHLLGDYQGLAAAPDGGAFAVWVTSPDGTTFAPRLARLAP